MELSISESKRFQVALSFAGEFRAYVENVANALQKMLGPDMVFYDNFFLHELARPNLDTYLLKIYREESELVVVFLCEQYATRQWCGLEWRAVRDMIKAHQAHDIMPFVFGHDAVAIEGLLSIDGYIQIADRAPFHVAELIVRRVESRLRDAHKKTLVEVVIDENFDTYGAAEIDRVVKLLRAILSDTNVRIVSKRKGSVVLTLLLSEEQLDTLNGALVEGRLRHLNVTSVRGVHGSYAVTDSRSADSVSEQAQSLPRYDVAASFGAGDRLSRGFQVTEEPRLWKWLKAAAPYPTSLMWCHTIDAFALRRTIEAASLIPKRCPVFHEDLLYLYYGRPVFRGAQHSQQFRSASAPVLVILETEVLLKGKRLFPFDTCAFAANRYQRWIHEGINLSDFELKCPSDAPQRFVTSFFGSNVNYLRERAQQPPVPYDGEFEVGALAALLTDRSVASADDGRVAIELQVAEPIEFTKDNIRALILPNQLLDAPYLKSFLAGAGNGIEVYGYELKPFRLAGDYHGLFEERARMLQESWGLS